MSFGFDCEFLLVGDRNPAKLRSRVIKLEQMLRELWGENNYFLGRNIDVFVTKLRKYLQEYPKLSVENVFGVGLIFHVPEN